MEEYIKEQIIYYIYKLKEEYSYTMATDTNRYKFYNDLDNYNNILLLRYNIKSAIIGEFNIISNTISIYPNI